MAGQRGASRYRLQRRARRGGCGALSPQQGDAAERYWHVIGALRVGTADRRAVLQLSAPRQMFARETPEPGKTRVVAQCRDADFERLVRSTFGMDGKVELTVVTGAFANEVRKLDT